MSKTRECIFIEDLLEFCLEKRGIVWKPEPRDGQIEATEKLFDETIGNAVIKTFAEYESIVQDHCKQAWNRISELIVPLQNSEIQIIMNYAALAIIRSDKVVRNTYVFLAFIVGLSYECLIRYYPKEYLQEFVLIASGILNDRLPRKFILFYDELLKYANCHSQPPKS